MDERLKDHERRITAIEASTGDLRVEVGKLGVQLDNVCAGQAELKSMLSGRIERDEHRQTALEQQRVENEGRLAIAKAFVDPRTLLIVSTVVASNCGGDAMQAIAAFEQTIPELPAETSAEVVVDEND